MNDMNQEQPFDLLSYVRVVLRRKWLVLGLTMAMVAAVGVFTYRQPTMYKTAVSILIGKETPRLVSSDILPEDEYRDREYKQTQSMIIGSRSFLEGSVKRLMEEGFYGQIPEAERATRLEGLVKALQPRVAVFMPPGSKALRIEVKGQVPERVARIANTIAEEYVNSKAESRQTMAGQAITWLEKKLDEQKRKLNEAETTLQTFKDKEDIVQTDDSDPFSTLNLTRLNDEYMTTRFQRMELETRLETLRQQIRAASSAPEGAPSSTATLDDEVQDAFRERLKKEYVDGQLQLRELSQRYGPEHPDIITLKGKVDKIAQELESLEQPGLKLFDESEPTPVSAATIMELESTYNVLRNKEKALESTLNIQRAAARKLSKTAVRYSLLRQEVDLNRQTYNDLLTRLNGVRLSSQIESPEIQILDRAEVPEDPFQPKPKRNLAMAVMLGLVLGIGLAILIEYLDPRVRTPQDVARHLRLPLLTVVPAVARGKREATRKKARLVTLSDPLSHAAECYRNLRTSILFSSGRPVPKVLLVTSAVAGEGKSTTATNLAVVMAQSGQKTLLVDADLRRPALHRYFLRDGNRGMARLLTPKDRFEEAIQASGLPNLDLILCPGVQKNPSEELGSGRFKQAIEEFKSRYDMILIDAPIVISVPDAIVLASRADAVVMVHRPGTADREMVRHAMERLQQVDAKILGLVMNNVNMKSHRYLYPEYHYYGYGAEEDKKARKKDRV